MWPKVSTKSQRAQILPFVIANDFNRFVDFNRNGAASIFDEFEAPFNTLKFMGMTENPPKMISKGSSALFESYVRFTCLFCMIVSTCDILGYFRPDLAVNPLYLMMSPTETLAYTVWCTTATLLRCVLCYYTLNKDFARALQEAVTDISKNKFFTSHFRSRSKTALWMNSVGILAIVCLSGINMSIYFFKTSRSLSELAYDPLTYVFVLECVMIAASSVLPNIFLAVICFISKQLFKANNRYLADSIKKEGVLVHSVLQDTIHQHTLAWNLVEVYDRILKWIISLTFVSSTSLFALVFAKLISNSRSLLSTVSLCFWNLSLISTITFVSVVSSMTNCEAEASLPLLLKQNAAAWPDQSLLHFIQRLSTGSVGFTFLNFFTIRKTTMLTILNFMVTYLIVALQMT